MNTAVKCINYSCPGMSCVYTLEFTFTVHAQNIVAIENVTQYDDDDDDVDDDEDATIMIMMMRKPCGSPR